MGRSDVGTKQKRQFYYLDMHACSLCILSFLIGIRRLNARNGEILFGGFTSTMGKHTPSKEGKEISKYMKLRINIDNKLIDLEGGGEKRRGKINRKFCFSPSPEEVNMENSDIDSFMKGGINMYFDQ